MTPGRSIFSDHQPAEKSIAEIAAEWLARHDRGLTRLERDEFERWHAADPAHSAEFERISVTWQQFDLAKADPELAAMAQALDDETKPGRSASRNKVIAWAGLAVAMAAAVVGFISVRPPPRTQDAHVTAPRVASSALPSALPAPSYQVVPSVARSLKLPDGSTALLRGDAEVRLDFSAQTRAVHLTRGEAQFQVAHDPARPFVVGVKGVAVRAVGTAFNVRLAATELEVLVTHGKVRVDDIVSGESLLLPLESAREPAAPSGGSQVLAVNQRVLIAYDPGTGAPAKAAVEATSPSDVDHALAWQSIQLIFNRTTLAEAVDAFNQHAPTDGRRVVRLALGDETLRRRQLGGTFRVGNVEAFVRLLEQAAGVRAEHRGEQEIILFPER